MTGPQNQLLDADVGLRTLARVHERLMIDEPWTVRLDRGFAWLGHRLAQEWHASPPFVSRDVLGVRVRARTPVVRGATAPEERVVQALALRNARAVGSAYLVNVETRDVELVSSHFVHDGTFALRSEQLASYGILQLCEAEASVGWWVDAVGGEPAFAEHPRSGLRVVPDDMLNVVQAVYAPRGAGGTRFADAAELQAVAATFADTGLVSLGADANSVCVEAPFGPSDTALVTLRSDERHPDLGAGLSVRTMLPVVSAGATESARTAARLQLAQAGTVEGGGGFGAWTVAQARGGWAVTWTRFVPEANYLPLAARDVALGEGVRAMWADELLFPGLPRRDARQVLGARYRGTGRPYA